MMKRIFELHQTLRKMKSTLIIATILYAASFILGWSMANAPGIFVLELRLGFANAYAWLHQPFNTISSAIIQSIFPWTRQPPSNILPLQIPSLSRTQTVEYLAVLSLVLFAMSLLYAFAATTLPGVVPVAGTILVGFVAIVEGVALGVMSSAAAQFLNPFTFVPNIFLLSIIPIFPTFISEVLTSSAGFYISFATVHARHESRWLSFKAAWRDTLRIYVLAVTLLAIASVVDLIGYILIILWFGL
jgi:hypothetical protein